MSDNYWREKILDALAEREVECIEFLASTNDVPFEDVMDDRQVAHHSRDETRRLVGRLNDDGSFAANFHDKVDRILTIRAFKRDEVKP